LKFNKGDPYQFTWKAINREILKAYTGFCFFKKESRIITGGWGCGAYNGDFITKVIIQWIAASMAGKDIVICPFGRKKSLEQIKFV
jgi:poly(ADP-ribose) glycohydrolase